MIVVVIVVNTRQSSSPDAIMRVPFLDARRPGLGVEVLTVSNLWRAMGREHMSAVQRPEFTILLFPTSGKGRHTVDFVDHVCVPGRVVLVRAGQVQRFHDSGYDGHLVVAWSSFGIVAGADLPGSWELRPEDRSAVLADVATLAEEQERYDRSAISRELVHTLYRLIACRALRGIGTRRSIEDDTIYRRFCSLLERNHAQERDVIAYAARLGVSTRTLSRVCLATTRLTPKRLVDERVCLEGKRLLAHTQHSVSDIAQLLGFSEPTNFVKFFRRVAGITPQHFRLGDTDRS